MSSNIHVLYIAGRVNTRNGAFHSLKANLLKLKDKNVDPIVIIHKHGDTEEELKKIGVKYYVIPYHGCTIPYDNPSKLKGMVKQIWNSVVEIKIAQIIKKESIDIVHINVGSTSLGAASALRLKKPLVWHLREFLEEDVNLTYINPRKTISLMKATSSIIAISEAVADHFKSRYGLENITSIYNGIAFDNLLSCKKISREKGVTLSIVGRIVPTKGQLDAVKALAILKKKTDVPLMLNIVGDVGNSDYYKEILKAISQNGLEKEVRILSHKSDLTEVWKETDIALICSTKEGFGRVTAEFMLNGIPIIGANTGATPELLRDGRGYIYKYSDIDDLADKVIEVVDDPENAEKIACEAQKYAVNEFTAESCAEKVFGIYKKVLEPKRI